MDFKVVARRSGNTVEFEVSAPGTKEAYELARNQANEIFSYRQGDPGAPTVSVKPLVDPKDD